MSGSRRLATAANFKNASASPRSSAAEAPSASATARVWPRRQSPFVRPAWTHADAWRSASRQRPSANDARDAAKWTIAESERAEEEDPEDPEASASSDESSVPSVFPSTTREK